MKNLYTVIFTFLLVAFGFQKAAGQCQNLTATFDTYESRCTATGAIRISASGGSGSYKYKVSGPVSSDYTSSDSITGLSSGYYQIEVYDIVSGCKFFADSIEVEGNYTDPRFQLNGLNVTCDNGNNGSILADNIQGGRAPLLFEILPPSPSGVGLSNFTGEFQNLIAGDYTVRMTDSCGGIQTRVVSIQNYSWKIDEANFNKTSCTDASGYIKVSDSKGNVSTLTGIPGMLYGISTNGTDTTWSSDPNFILNAYQINSVQVFAKDGCGIVKSLTVNFNYEPQLDNNVTIYDQTCYTFSVAVTGMKNFLNPTYCLYDEDGNLVSCSPDGKFTGLAYGYYCIKVTDDCSGQVVTRCFNPTSPDVSVDDDVLITDKQCRNFTVSIKGQKNLTNPSFCLYKNGILLDCNFSGSFFHLPYGSYCIQVKDGCKDTTIERCFTVKPPTPIIPDVIIPSYSNCTNFGLDIKGDSLTRPTYCLYDSAGNVIQCNNTGQFDSIPLGNYCVTVHDDCRDTTFRRCFSVGQPVIQNDMVVNQINKACSTFTASVGTNNLKGSTFCLYDKDDNEIACNKTGIFDLLPYGKYCIKAHPDCPDTTVMVCFTALQPIPAVSSSVSLSAMNCNTFTAAVRGQTNLINPRYFLTNEAGDTLSQNTSGTFNKLSYGKYCILVKDGCYDTTIKVCFTATPPVFTITPTASMSCNYGTSKFKISSSTYPATISVYSPSNVLIFSQKVNSSVTLDNIPNLAAGLKYRIEAEDDCGNKGTTYLAPVVATFSHSTTVDQKCPGSKWPNGSGNINATVNINTGPATVRLIKKNGIAYSPALSPDKADNAVYTFFDLGPGTYIISYNSNDGCNVYQYDTVTVNPYAFPNLSRSSAYHCDQDGFSVGAVVTNGVGPFTYEIIGSAPSIPSIKAGPQASPIFNINNGYNYSLIRLRALDACGNSALGDASVLPLANNYIRVNENCIGSSTFMKIDTVFNSTVAWYFKKNKGANDSTYLGGNFQMNFNPLTYADTGYYYCIVETNGGCIRRTYGFNLNGSCFIVAGDPMVTLAGTHQQNKNHLTWKVLNGESIQEYFIERLEGNQYKTIGHRNATDQVAKGLYQFDEDPPATESFYRLRMLMSNGKVMFSKVVSVRIPIQATARIYPNPAIDFVTIEFNSSENTDWQIELMNLAGQKLLFKDKIAGPVYRLEKPSSLQPGMYLLKVSNSRTGFTDNFKVVFGR